MNETNTLKQEYLNIKNTGANIIRILQDGGIVMDHAITTWYKCADDFANKWDMAPDSIKAEACPDADRNFKLQILLQRDLMRTAVDLRDSSKHDEKQFPLPWAPVITDEDKIRPAIDQIIAERGKIHGDANWSGTFFYGGIEILRDVNEKSAIPRPDAFNGHLYMAMFKMLRLMHNPYHRDNYDDLLGYLKLAMTALENKNE